MSDLVTGSERAPRRAKLTRTLLESIQAPAAGALFIWDTELKGFGIRITAQNSRSFIVQRRVHGRSVRYTLDRLDVLSPEAARSKARIALGEMGAGVDPVKRDRELTAAERARIQASRRQSRTTFKAMLEAYIEYLEEQGRYSARDVRSLFKKHVYTADPELCARPAGSIAPKDITQLLRRLCRAGKGPQAVHLRSFLHAAFARAIGRANDPDVAYDQASFGVENNPVAVVDPMRQYKRSCHRVLSTAELREVLQRLEALGTSQAALALRFALFAGGQRPKQVLRLKVSDVDLESGRAVLMDPKGRRTAPRVHEIYPGPAAMAILERQLARAKELKCDLVFSNRDPSGRREGLRPIDVCTLSLEIRLISRAMVKERKSTLPFMSRDLRRTAETMMAGLGIAPHIRAHVMSHGLSGLQVRHYDRHDYIDEKRAAALAWEGHLARICAGPAKETLQLAAAA